jgi:hypothetical protein
MVREADPDPVGSAVMKSRPQQLEFVHSEKMNRPIQAMKMIVIATVIDSTALTQSPLLVKEHQTLRHRVTHRVKWASEMEDAVMNHSMLASLEFDDLEK